MPRGIHNWTYRDLRKFLKDYGFEYSQIRSPDGSHRYFFKKTPKGEFVVDAQYLTGKESYPPKTMETMIEQSGISKKEWINWTRG